MSDNAGAAFLSLQARALEKITPDENHLVAADVNFLPSDGTVLVAKVLLQMGSGYLKTQQLVTSYGANEYIYIGNGLGSGNMTNCGCGSNQNGVTDCADKRIAQRLNNTLDGLQAPCYYTNVESHGISWIYSGYTFGHNVTDYPTGIPATPYKFWYCPGTTCFTAYSCITPGRMTFYTQKAYDVMMQLKPSTKTVVSANLEDVQALCDCPSWHGALFVYAKLNCPK
jgi:hypothetical protein